MNKECKWLAKMAAHHRFHSNNCKGKEKRKMHQKKEECYRIALRYMQLLDRR